MAGFCYFLETQDSSISRETIEEVGLGYAFENSPECSESLAETPTGSHGVFFADHVRLGEGMRAGYFPDEQEWLVIPATDPKIAVGYWSKHKPSPEDLMRESPLPGLAVKLADENFWTVPTVRKPTGQEWHCELPCRLTLNEQGRLVSGTPLSKYQRLWEITEPVAKRMLEADTHKGEPLSDEQAASIAVELLQANYVIDVPELVLLNALATDGSLGIVCSVAVMKDRLLSWIDTLQKKSNDQQTDTGSISANGGKV